MFGRQEKKNKILFLIDSENIKRNVEMPPPGRFSTVDGFDRVVKQIAQEVGEIIHVFACAPPQVASIWGEDLHELGFTIVYCPRIRDKSGQEEDTVDRTLRELAREMINLMPGITHLCIGSGDADFIWSIRKAIRKRLKIMIVAGNLTSLSGKLIKLADKNPLTGERMVYLFSPTETKD